ncbi:abortive infection family protein [Psychrosphaera sp. B3R10]|uniref:abortive infection family protein n=1 Tax=unclassified Psychrosphaera TaxID=2641570 RepID=UPI001C0A6457|nr:MULTISPECIES: abortive infection family protein [unclassified Psychrosphaera]MBU2882268.1 abortive infection family protein [Psychrosphaera sp. I2R16]MBU2988949.1 abortive infection family protein [Psychrosphaera sp. B3R10]
MSNLSKSEKRKLERMLGMASGFVIDFSNRTFEEFILESTGKEIYDEKYNLNSGSKANRMRAFWDIESNFTVGKLLGDIFDEWGEYKGINNTDVPSDECLKIVQRLKLSAPVPDIDAVVPNTEDKDFETLAKAVRDTIDRNEPEVGLDRLHTFLVKYFRVLCGKYDIETDKKKPLHSLVGEYIKKMKASGVIESEMTERILKSSIANMEAFNHVRNNQSFAHDNNVLKYSEAMLIFGHVTSSIRFIEELEQSLATPKHYECT